MADTPFFLSPEILGFIQRAKEVEGLSQLEAESLLLNVHHGELGGLIAQHWKLPPRVVQGIIHHHDPDQGRDVICDLTHLANQFAKYIEANLEGRSFDPAILPSVIERLRLTPKTIDELGPAMISRYAQVSGRYNSI